MNRKARILLIGTVLAISGIVIRGTGNANANLPENLSTQNYTSISSELNDINTIAQYGGSPWGQVAIRTTYTNPETGQQFCFYRPAERWAPCPGQGDTAIIPRGAKCRGSQSGEALLNRCPAAICGTDRVSLTVQQMTTGTYVYPCTGLP